MLDSVLCLLLHPLRLLFFSSRLLDRRLLLWLLQPLQLLQQAQPSPRRHRRRCHRFSLLKLTSRRCRHRRLLRLGLRLSSRRQQRAHWHLIQQRRQRRKRRQVSAAAEP